MINLFKRKIELKEPRGEIKQITDGLRKIKVNNKWEFQFSKTISVNSPNVRTNSNDWENLNDFIRDIFGIGGCDWKQMSLKELEWKHETLTEILAYWISRYIPENYPKVKENLINRFLEMSKARMDWYKEIEEKTNKTIDEIKEKGKDL